MKIKQYIYRAYVNYCSLNKIQLFNIVRVQIFFKDYKDGADKDS